MWRMSGVLQFYDLVSTGNGTTNASVTGRCRECGKTIKGFRNITSNFVTHLRNVHKRVYEAYDLTRPHKGSRKRSRSNAYEQDGAANSADDSANQTRELEKLNNSRQEDESIAEKRLQTEPESDKRARKVVVKRDSNQQEPTASYSVHCPLADYVAPRCDAPHASMARLCLSTNEPLSFAIGTPFRSLLHATLSGGNSTGIASALGSATVCSSCTSLSDLLVATYLRTRAKVRSLLVESDLQLNLAFDVVRLSRSRERPEALVAATLNFVPVGSISEMFLYTTTVAVARMPFDSGAIGAFARTLRTRLMKACDGYNPAVPVRRIASVSCELDQLETILNDRNVSLLQPQSDELPGYAARDLEAVRERIVLAVSTDADDATVSAHVAPCADLTALRCFQNRVERALNDAIRSATRNSEPFRELRRSVTALRSVLDRAHRAAISLLQNTVTTDLPKRVATASFMHPNGSVRSNGGDAHCKHEFDAPVDTASASMSAAAAAAAAAAASYAEVELRAFVGWLKTLRTLDSASASGRRWNIELKMLRRLLDVDVVKAALLRRVVDVDLEWLVDVSRRPEAEWSATLREFVNVVQPFEEVLDVFDASSQISVSLAVPCLFGFDSHLTEIETTVQFEPNRSLVRQILGNLHAEFAFIFNALDGDSSSLDSSEQRVVDTLLCGTLLDPRFKVTCFEETPAHKAIAVHALRNLLAEREHHADDPSVFARLEREVDEYLEEDIIAQVNDPLRVLEFWRTNARQWPSLYRLASEILAVPATRSPFQRVLTDLLAFAGNTSRRSQATTKFEPLDPLANGVGEPLQSESTTILSLLDRIGSVDLLDTQGENEERDLQFSEAKRFALKCNLDLLDHVKFFSA